MKWVKKVGMIGTLILSLATSGLTAQAERPAGNGSTITWGEVQTATYSPLLNTIIGYTHELMQGGFALAAKQVTQEEKEADLVINRYGDMGARAFLELPGQDLSEPTDPNSSKYVTLAKAKTNTNYLLQLHDGTFAKVRIDRLTPFAAELSYVFQSKSGEREVSSLALSKETLTLSKNDSAQLTATVTYKDGTQEECTDKVNWSSDNEGVATVSKGKVMAKAEGSARVTATYGGASAKTTIKVTADSSSQPDTIKPVVGAGGGHLLGLQDDGTIWAWGDGSYGQLGDGDVQYKREPMQVKDATDVVAVTGSMYDTVLLKKDGTVWGMGRNYYGQIGNGKNDKYVFQPDKFKGLSEITAISAGETHTLALKKDGTVWAVGQGIFGQLGEGKDNPQDRKIAVKVKGLTDVIAIAAGAKHSLAVTSNGNVWAWGLNDQRQAGNETEFKLVAPEEVEGLSDVVAVSAGDEYSLALKKDGTVWAWGSNADGQLGNEDDEKNPVPVQIEGLTEIIAIEAGSTHALALKKDGTVWAWGKNENGQLGTEDVAFSPWPLQVSGLSTIVSIAAGYNNSIALQADGSVWNWGYKTYDGTTIGDHWEPVRIPTLDLGESSEKIVKALTPKKKKLTLKKGASYQMGLTAAYTDGTKEEIANAAAWTSSKETVAIVANGRITAKAKGKTAIKAKFADKEVTISVTVTD